MEPAVKCFCGSCKLLSDVSEEDKESFELTTKTDFNFPPFNQTVEKFNYDIVVKAFDESLPVETRRKHVHEVVRFLTYADVSKFKLSLANYILICANVSNDNSSEAIREDTLAKDYLRRITRLFVQAWHALKVDKNQKAGWAAKSLRSYMAVIVGFPILEKHVNEVFFKSKGASDWSAYGPVQVLQSLAEDHLDCRETVSLLTNLTRIDGFCELLASESNVIEKLKENFHLFCTSMQNYTDYSYILLLLYMNVSVLDDFMEVLLTSDSNFFPAMILPDLIGDPSSHEPNRKIVWPFLRNLALREAGRKLILDNLDAYLGHILYPIAGPEELRDDVNMKLPLEVTLLPNTKQRVADTEIRNSIVDILYSLCRYKKDREELRDRGVYEILRHYHLAEQDKDLLEKIEDLVNILIRKEDAEIVVDDLLDGLTVKKISQVPIVSKPYRWPSNNMGISSSLRPRLIKFLQEAGPCNAGDESVDVKFNPCTFEVSTNEPHPFDYMKYALGAQMVMIHYQNVINKNGTPKTRPPSEGYVQRKVTEKYGDIDFSSEEFSILKPVIVEAMLEIQSLQEGYSDEALDAIAYSLGEFDMKDIDQDLENYVTEKKEEMDEYRKLKPVDADGDWFVVPRPAVKLLGRKYFSQYNRLRYLEPYDDGKKDEQTEERESRELTNLHLYDPKIHLTFELPHRILLDYEKDLYNVPRNLSVNILTILNEHPNGLTAPAFFKKYRERFENNPLDIVKENHLRNLLIIHKFELYFCKLSKPDVDLFFPQMLRGVIDLDVTLRRIWHAIRCVLGTVENIRGQELFEKIRELYGINFDPADWGLTVKQFVDCLLEQFAYAGAIKSCEFYDADEDNVTGESRPDTYFTINANTLKVYQTPKNKLWKAAPGEFQELALDLSPVKLVRWGDPISDITDTLDLRRKYLVDLVTTHSQTLMIARICSCTAEIDKLHTKLQKKSKAKFYHYKPVHEDQVRPGMYMMAFVKWWSLPCWYRVKILKYKGKNVFKVYGIDFGFLEPVNLEDLRYMLYEDSFYPSYAIPFSFQFSKKYFTKYGTKFLKLKEATEAINAVYPQQTLLGLKAVDTNFDAFLGCRKWVVSASVMDYNGNVIFPDMHCLYEKACMAKLKLKRKAAQIKQALKEANKAKTEQDVVHCQEEEEMSIEGKPE